MSAITEQVFIEALSLPTKTRAELAHKLLTSLEREAGSPEIEAAWKQEALDRCKAFDEGNLSERDATDVLRDAYKSEVKRITYLSVAEVELTEAAEYYDEQQSGLGRDFLDSIRSSELAIQHNPELWAYFERPIRAYRVQPFSYRLLYREFPDKIQIVAVMHTSRHPDYWKDRI